MKKQYVIGFIMGFLLLIFLPLIFHLQTMPSGRYVITTERSLENGQNSLLLLATGDIMVHDKQIQSVYRPDKKAYDYSEWFAEVEEYLREGDLVVGNLETTLAGEDLGYSGYPAFNSPESLAFYLKQTGFDLVSTANNHCLDRGEKGVLRTIEQLEKVGLDFFGTSRSLEERDEFLYITRNDITVVFLAYTYGTNGIPVPPGKEYLVNLLDKTLIESDIKRARTQADLVVVSLHWGQEYSREPHPEQQHLAESIISWGGDLILGSHPHVLQPVEFIRAGKGSEERQGVVVNSLGNFVSDQFLHYTDSGLIVRFHYVKEKGVTRLVQATCVPTWVHRFYREGRLAYRVLPVKDALCRYENGEDPYLNIYDYNNLQRVWQETTDHIWLTPYSKSGF